MAGAHIILDDSAINQVLQHLLNAVTDLTPAMREIGEMLKLSHDDRFREQVSSDGEAWAPLSENTKKRKPEHLQDKILQLSGALRLNLAYNADNNGLEFGSNAIYAATHQFGADKGAFGSGVPW
ncbi:MAG: phage virion morphogenesis protein, partial [Mariprofundales bacterium]